jgi:Uncharacterised protein family (UPF0137)
MAKINDLLAGRFLKKREDQPTKMAEMAQRSADGRRNTFSGVFHVSDLPQEQKDDLRGILDRFADEDQTNVDQDHRALVTITCEVRAISNQAALLHGERIKKAQTILKGYREGAFSAWLMTTYGNRQTPYNFLQYFEFYSAMPKALHPQIELMPRQAVYTLASREGDLQEKRQIVESYEGQTKNELLHMIRDAFPLADGDRRRKNPAEGILNSLRRVHGLLSQRRRRLSETQQAQIRMMLREISNLLEPS